MIDARVDYADLRLSMEGDSRTITSEFLMLVGAVYKGVKKAGEIPAQLFREGVVDMIGLCFKEDAVIISVKHDELERVQKLITGIEEILAMFPKEENS